MDSWFRFSKVSIRLLIFLAILSVQACGGGSGGSSAPQTVSSPTSFIAAKDVSSVTLTWDSVVDASAYEIYWSTTSGVTESSNKIVLGVVTTYNHTSLASDTYYYRILAKSGSNTSILSNEISVTVSNWAVITPTPTPNTLWAGSANNSLSVLVGERGVILTSADGDTWTERTTSNENTLRDVIYSNSQFIAVGDNGTIATSPDAITWTYRASGTTNNLSAIATHNGTYYAVGNSGTILVSSDTISWVPRTSGTTESLVSIASSGSLLVAVGTGDYAFYSSDGVTWSQSNILTNPIHQSLNGIIWTGTEFIAVGDFNAMHKSFDGITWTKAFQPIGHFYDITKTANGIVASGSYGNSAFRVISYDDGATWTGHSVGGGRFYTSLHEFNGKGYFTGTFGGIYETSNYSSFVLKSSAANAARFTGLATDGTQIFMSAGGGNDISLTYTDIFYSTSIGHAITPDEFNNTTYTYIDGNNYYGTTYANGEFIKVGTNGKFVRIINPTTFTSYQTSSNQTLADIAYNGTIYVAVGAGGYITTSSDFSTWTTRNTGSYTLYSIKWTGSEFIAVGEQGKILRSSDGISWSVSDLRTPATDALTSIATNGTRLIVTSYDGHVFTSDDSGSTWVVSTQLSTAINSIRWTGTKFIATLNNGLFASSSLGDTWTIIDTLTNSTLMDSITVNNTVYIVGSGGLIIKTN